MKPLLKLQLLLCLGRLIAAHDIGDNKCSNDREQVEPASSSTPIAANSERKPFRISSVVNPSLL